MPASTWLVGQAAYVARFGHGEWTDLTDTDGSGQPDGDMVAAAVADTTADVSRYLRQAGYGALVGQAEGVPEDLRRRALDILRYLLHRNRPSDEVRERYRDAVAWFDALVAGDVVLYGADGQPLPRRVDEPNRAHRAVGNTRRMVYGADFLRRYG